MRPQRKALVIVLVVATLVIGLVNALALTPAERKKVQSALTAVNTGIEHEKLLQAAAEQARIEADNANRVAGMAASSAFQAGVKARDAQTEAERCQKENAEMRPIVKAVTGPWWFPGLNALLYGAKKSAISLLVIIAGIVVIGICLKIFAPGVFALFGVAGKTVGRFGGRALELGKKILPKRKPKSKD